MAATRVVNLRRERCDVYIGRSGAKYHFGNPFHIGSHGSRKEVVEMFRQWLRGDAFRDVEQDRRAWIFANLWRLEGKRLGCWCKPLLCHGDIYVRMLEKGKI